MLLRVCFALFCQSEAAVFDVVTSAGGREGARARGRVCLTYRIVFTLMNLEEVIEI